MHRGDVGRAALRRNPRDLNLTTDPSKLRLSLSLVSIVYHRRTNAARGSWRLVVANRRLARPHQKESHNDNFIVMTARFTDLDRYNSSFYSLGPLLTNRSLKNIGMLERKVQRRSYYNLTPLSQGDPQRLSVAST